MAILVWTDCTVWLDEFDATCNLNTVSLAGNAEPKDATTFCSDGWRQHIPGLKSFEFTYGGFGDFDAGMIDAVKSGNLGTSVVHTISPDGADGSVAYLFVGVDNAYKQTSQIGEIHAVEGSSVNGNGSYGAVRGRVLGPKQTVTGNLNGTASQLGAVASDERLFIAVHVFSAGTTADVIVESDDASNFPSATTRSTTTVTAAGGTFVTPVAGPFTDDWWRVRFANVTGSFSVAVAVGIA